MIEFQNILSSHITIYYFGKDLKTNETEEIKEILIQLNKKNLNIGINKFKYFGDKICYLEPKENICFSGLNKLFKEYFISHNHIKENKLDFVPHLTLFKIKDPEKYKIYKNEIEKVINIEIKKLKNIDLYEGINLYKVNSNFSPEIQIKI